MRLAHLRSLFWLFFRIGLFTFGGGMAMIPLMRAELCDRQCLVAEDDFVECIALAQCAPGPIAGNVAVLLGHRLAGWAGAGAALAGVAVPAFLVLSVIAWQYSAWRDQAWASRLFAGLRPTIVVLIAYATLRMSRLALRSQAAWAVFTGSVVGMMALGLHPLVIVLGAAGVALLRSLIIPPSGGSGEGCADDLAGPAD